MSESRGMDIIRSNDGSILFRVALFDASGVEITTAANLNIGHFVPASGDLETYDFDDDTFKTTAVTTFNQATTHEQMDNNTEDTGIHVYRHPTLTDFAIGDKYVARVTHASLPQPIITEFQYGDLNGDIALNLPLLRERETAQAGAAGSITLAAAANANDDFYNEARISIIAGIGVGQSRFADDYDGTSKVLTISPNWVTNPDSTSEYVITPVARATPQVFPTVADIVDGVWDENIVTGHGGAQSAGLLLRVLGANIAARSFNADLDSLFGVPDTGVTDTIVGQIWEELAASHNNASTMGELLNNAGVVLTAGQVENAVWDANLDAGHGAVNSAGLFVRVLASAIAARVNNPSLNALLAVPDSAGVNLPDVIWNENLFTAHGTADTAGFFIRQLAAGIAQRTNSNSLAALLAIADNPGDTIAFPILDTVIDGGNHVVANSLAQRVRAVDLLTESGGAGDLAVTLAQSRKLDLDPVGVTDPDSIAGKLDSVAANILVIDREIVTSFNLQGGATFRIEVGVKQFGVIQTTPFVDAVVQIFDEAGSLVVNEGIVEMGTINTRGFFVNTVSPHGLVAGTTYEAFVQITDGAVLSISTTVPFKILQG